MKNLILLLVTAISLSLGVSKVEARGGGYLSFPLRDTNAPEILDELNFFFRMTKNPGPKAYSYYAQNFHFKMSDSSQLDGYMGLQSSDYPYGSGTATYALVTIWPRSGVVLKMTPGPDAKCAEDPNSGEGHVASCVITKDNPLAGPMEDGDTYKIYVKEINKTLLTYTVRFGIVNLRTGNETVLGDMTLTGVAGISSQGLSNFLEYFGGDTPTCETTPYTVYTQYAPVGYASGLKVNYSIVEDPNGMFGDCPHLLTFNSDSTAAIVEYSIKTLSPIQ